MSARHGDTRLVLFIVFLRCWRFQSALIGLAFGKSESHFAGDAGMDFEIVPITSAGEVRRVREK